MVEDGPEGQWHVVRTTGAWPPIPARCGSTRSSARWWPTSSSAWPTPTSGSAWSPSTSVETTADLRQATVYLSSLSDEAAAALEQRRVQVQKAVARQTKFKRTPQLSFVQDPAVVTGNRIEDLLRQIHESDDAAGRVETDGRDDNYR